MITECFRSKRGLFNIFSRRITALAVGALVSLVCVPLMGAHTLPYRLNFDLTVDSRYPSGNKPQTPTASCTTVTCASKGNASGEIHQDGTTLFFNQATGDGDGWSGAEQNIDYAYITRESGDAQVCTTVPETWTGHLEDYTGFMVGVTEGGSSDDWTAWIVRHHNGSLYFKHGVPGTSVAAIQGPTLPLPLHLCATFDDSANVAAGYYSTDGIDFVLLGSSSRDLSNYRPFVGGTSHEALASTAAVLTWDYSDDITIADDMEGAPECGPIPNQVWTEGQSVSFDVSAYCSGDGSLSYSATGLSGRGLAISSIGVISGMPNSTAVSASPFQIVVTATDSMMRATQALFTANVVASSGTDWYIPFNANQQVIIDCEAMGIKPGDTVTFQGGIRLAQTVVRWCEGAPGAHIVVRNDPTSTVPLVLSRSGGTGNFVMRWDNNQYTTLDGTGKYVGAPAGVCGDTDGNVAKCGIQFRPSSENTQPSSYFKINGVARHMTIRGVACDVRWQSDFQNTRGICFHLHDNSKVLPPGVSQADVMNGAAGTAELWNENWIIEHTVCRNAREECRYVGTNYSGGGAPTNNYPLRNIIIRYNWDQDIYSCTRLKSMIGGGSRMHDNVCINSGIDPTHSAAIHAFQLYEAGSSNPNEVAFEFYRNIIIDTKHGGNPGGGGDCLFVYSHNRPANLYGTYRFHAWGNLCYEAGRNGITVGANGTDKTQAIPMIEYNTIVDTANEVFGRCVEVNSSITTSGGYIRHNICAGTGAAIANRNHQNSNNFVNSSKAAAGFISTTPGSENFRLSSGSSNVDAGGAHCAEMTDLDGAARPQGSACDRGAYERTP